MASRSKQKVESEVNKAMKEFLVNQMGEQPDQVTTQIVGEMIIVRLKGVLPSAEKRMTMNREGKELITELKTKLMEKVKPLLELLIRKIADVDIVAIHSSFDADSAERIEVFTLSKNLEEVLS